MSDNKQIYEVPLYAYFHYDNTWTYSDYIKIKSSKEPKVVERKQYSIGRDETEDTALLLIYRVE